MKEMKRRRTSEKLSSLETGKQTQHRGDQSSPHQKEG